MADDSGPLRASAKKRMRYSWLKDPENPEIPRSTLHRLHSERNHHVAKGNKPENVNFYDEEERQQYDESSTLVHNEDDPNEAQVRTHDLEINNVQSSSSDFVGNDFDDNNQINIHEDVLTYSSEEGSDSDEDLRPETQADLGDQTTDTRKARKDLELPLFPGLQKTKFEVYLMSLFLSMRHGYTTVNLLDHFKFINEIFDQEVIPANTLYIFDNTFKSPFSIEFHYFCNVCFFYLGKHEDRKEFEKGKVCDICKSKCSGKSNFFMYIPMEQQLTNFMENTPGIEDLLSYRLKIQNSGDSICDVFDGIVYKKLLEDVNALSNVNNISITINTDGSPVFKSASNSLWPIQFRINELPPNLRFEKMNTMVCGIWFGEHDPNMNVFLAPLVKEANKLRENGFNWQNSTGINVNSKVFVLNCVLDSIAKPKVQCLKQFNGTFSCPYCYHPAFAIPGHPQSRFIMDDNVELNERHECAYTVSQYRPKTGSVTVHKVCDRTNEEVRHHMDVVTDGTGADLSGLEDFSDEEEEVDKSGTVPHIKGVKGKSPLYFILNFCLVFGFSLDYLHCVLLGVVKLVTSFHFDQEFSSEEFSIRSKLATVDSRLLNIKPPSSISRAPRTLKERKNWKGNEWRSYLLYYSVPCLSGILEGKYFKHHCLLVEAIFILLKDKITQGELKTAAWYLTLYVAEFQKLYGHLRMNFNVHLLLHLAKAVALYGPLWSFSAFTFESGNGFLVKLVKGTREVASQIVKKYITSQTVSEIVSLYTVSESTKNFCDNLMSYRLDKHAERKGSILLLGKPVRHPLSQEERDFCPYLPEISHERFIKNGTKFHAKVYTRQGSCSNDSFAKLVNGAYVVIERIFMSNEDSVSLLVRSVNVDSKFHFAHCGVTASVSHVKKCFQRTFGALSIIKASDVSHKAVFIDALRDSTPAYVIDMPNMFEKD